MIGFALLGAGVIGNIHAHNIALHPDYKLIHVIDPIILSYLPIRTHWHWTCPPYILTKLPRWIQS